jgi:hypothetical protein
VTVVLLPVGSPLTDGSATCNPTRSDPRWIASQESPYAAMLRNLAHRAPLTLSQSPEVNPWRDV